MVVPQSPQFSVLIKQSVSRIVVCATRMPSPFFIQSVIHYSQPKHLHARLETASLTKQPAVRILVSVLTICFQTQSNTQQQVLTLPNAMCPHVHPSNL